MGLGSGGDGAPAAGLVEGAGGSSRGRAGRWTWAAGQRLEGEGPLALETLRPDAWKETGLQVLSCHTCDFSSNPSAIDQTGLARPLTAARAGMGGEPCGQGSGPRVGRQHPSGTGAQGPGLRVRALEPRGAAPRAPAQEPRPREGGEFWTLAHKALLTASSAADQPNWMLRNRKQASHEVN